MYGIYCALFGALTAVTPVRVTAGGTVAGYSFLAAAAPGEEVLDRALVIQAAVRPRLLGDDAGIGARREARAFWQAVDLPAQPQLGRVPVDEHRELDARRPCVQDQDRVVRRER